MLISLVNISGFGLGLLMMMFAIVWSYSKSNEAKKPMEEISRYEKELYTIEKKSHETMIEAYFNKKNN